MKMSRLMPVMLYAVVWNSLACAEQQAAPEQSVLLNGRRLTLVEDQQRCAIKTEHRNVLSMEIPWPCQFSVDRDGKSHVETFHNVQIVKVLHIVPDPERPLNCITQSRTVRLINGRLELSPRSRSAACVTGVGDQKSYAAGFDW